MSDLINNPEYLKLRLKELDLYVSQLLTVCRTAVIESRQGNNKAAIEWIINYLEPRDEIPPECEVDSYKYFTEHSSKIDDDLLSTHKRIWEMKGNK
ncbi:MAG: hypothetical protein ACRDCI_11175 [Plesiomonas shigelloides]